MKKHIYKTDSGNEMETRRVGLCNSGKGISPYSFVICSLHETPFLGSTYIGGLTLQVLSDIKCLALLPNVQESKCSLLGDSAHPPRLAAFPVLQVLNLLFSCVPSHSSGKEGEPHAPLGYYPCTPSALLPSEPCSLLGCCVLGCDAH